MGLREVGRFWHASGKDGRRFWQASGEEKEGFGMQVEKRECFGMQVEGGSAFMGVVKAMRVYYWGHVGLSVEGKKSKAEPVGDIQVAWGLDLDTFQNLALGPQVWPPKNENKNK